jgi:hypothetical protein
MKIRLLTTTASSNSASSSTYPCGLTEINQFQVKIIQYGSLEKCTP